MFLQKLKKLHSVLCFEASGLILNYWFSSILSKLTPKFEACMIGLSSCLSVRVTCPSVRVSWTGLSSIRLALGLQEGKLGVTPAYVADTSHSKWAPPKLEHAPRLTRRHL